MRWRMKKEAVVVALVTGLLGAPVAWGQVIPPGQDCFETAAGSTRVHFGGTSQLPPLPNDFFFDGSQAWEGTIELVGDPLPDYVGSVNIVVERKEEAVMPGPATVAIELVELQLRSVDPIVVLDSQDPPGEHYYDVEVTLADTPSTGFMTIEATSPVGGEYRFDALGGGGQYVYASFIFFEAWPSRQDEPIVWDAPALLLQSDGPLPWQYEQPLLFCYPDQQFYPVPEYVATTLLDGGESGEHGVIPPREPEACCLQDGSCIDVDPDECANFYMGWAQGPGTVCEGSTFACCLQDGTGNCVDAEPQCCDELNGLPSPSGEPACLGDLTGNGVDDACEAECVPTADGLWCEDVLCPYPDETCWPKNIHVDSAAQTVTVTECACLGDNDCRVVYVIQTDPWSVTVTCQGGCPAGEQCELIESYAGGDSFDYECRCESECRPTPDGMTCEDVPCLDASQVCLPKVVSRNVPPVFFPPGGIDVITPTSGIIAIEDPYGVVESYAIMPGDPNITRVARGNPTDAGGYRVVDTEIIEMELMGGGGAGGTILVHQSPSQPSVGQMIGTTSDTTDFPAESFFDVYVTVDIPDMPGADNLYHTQAIPLSASGLMDVPPWDAPFVTPDGWPGVELLTAGGDPTGYTIVYVNHELPPPPPEYQIVECECMDPDYCHIEYDPAAEPTCTGGCPWPEICVMTVQDTDGDGIDDRWECVCEPECKPTPDGTACEEVSCPVPIEECEPKVVGLYAPPVFFPPGGIDILTPTSGVITVQDPSGATENYEIMPVDPNITRVLRGDPIEGGGYRVIDTEIIEMELVGGALGGMTILVHQSADQPSVGQMIGTTSDTTDFPAESFFDVYVTVDIPSAPGAEGLYHTAPIPLSASGLTDVPPWGAPFETPGGWNGVDLLDSFGEPTGYRIVYVNHELPPPPVYQIIECECMDPDYCHIAYDPAAEPTCTGNCPWPEVCVMHAQDTDGDGVDDLWECVCEPGLHPKWTQLPDDPEHNFEAKSDLWWHEELVTIKFAQPFNPEYPGIPSYDWFEGQIILAEDWLCEGGTVTDFHWWGGVFYPGSGIYGFRLSLHDAVLPECLPAEPPIWAIDVPIGQITVTPTGIFNGDNLEIIRYDYDLPPEFWFEQEVGSQYFVNISAISLDSWDPYVWRWQESARTMTPQHCAAAEYRLPVPGAWQTLTTDNLYFVDLAFAVTSQDTTPEVNKVVADDFTSDGRPIQALRWWGSYWDEIYAPDFPPAEPYVIDGWLLSFHHAEPEADCPPGSTTADVPTVLGVYFAPADMVQILGLDMGDCLGHGVYEYAVDLNDCCLICSEVDPRTGNTPALPYTFYEEAGFKYWLDIQAIVGAEWVPSSPIPEECELVLTGHLPSPNTPDGHFWGWHTSLGIASPYPLLDEACTGQIVGFAPYPPNCWDYGNWVTQPYLCPDPPMPFPVHMAFELLTADPVPVPLGACCLEDQSCVMLPGADACHEQGGVYLGDYIPCEDQCSTGACCDEDGCHETTREECVMASVCDAHWGADPPPQCMGDCNGDNRVNPQDVGLVKFYYGNTTMEALCRFDVNCDGTISPQDVGLVKYYYTDPCGTIPPSYLDPTCVAYYGVPGEWYGYGTYCEDGSGGGVTCACICPAGAAHESSAWCGYEDPDPNGGCYEDPWVFDPIACGEMVCGMVSIEPDPNVPGDQLIDTDWYEFTLTADAFVAWSVHSDFPAVISIYQSDCTLLTQNAGGGGDCGEVSLGVSLTPGTYYAVVEPDQDALLWLPCTGEHNRYYATLQCDSR